MNESIRQWGITFGVAGLILGLLLIDLQTPLGVANHILYLGPVLLSLLSPIQWLPFAVAGLVSLLIVAGGILSENPHEVPLWVPISNRAFSIWAMWMPVWYFDQRRKHEQQLQRMNTELDSRVKERTRQLATVNEALVAEITERMRTEQSLDFSRRELKRLASELIRVQEDERRRISRDLHDDINQRLALLAIAIEDVERQMPRLSEDLTHTVHAIAERITELSEDVRHLAYHYHPSILDDLGLSIAMRRLIEDVTARNNLHAHITCEDLPTTISPEIATCLYRVAQESLGNVVRHAKASRIDVSLERSRMGLTLTLADNGVGFASDHHRPNAGGLGLLSMKERVALVGGTLTIDSSVGAGTTVQASVPLREDV
ncbi:MAG: sensor histidine kinase [Nitrospira sp.]